MRHREGGLVWQGTVGQRLKLSVAQTLARCPRRSVTSVALRCLLRFTLSLPHSVRSRQGRETVPPPTPALAASRARSCGSAGYARKGNRIDPLLHEPPHTLTSTSNHTAATGT